MQAESKALYRVFIDESGDRGWGTRASRAFILTAVIVRDGGDAAQARAGLDHLCTTLRKPDRHVLHWNAVKRHDARKHVARTLATLPITVTTVVVVKERLGTRNPAQLYNYALRVLLERVSWCVDERGGEAIVTVAHVKNFPYAALSHYLVLLRSKGTGTTIRWSALRGDPRIDQPSRNRLLQLADLAAGCHACAFRRDPYGAFESAYINELPPRIYTRGRTSVAKYGLKIVPPIQGIEGVLPWWSEFCEACAQR